MSLVLRGTRNWTWHLQLVSWIQRRYHKNDSKESLTNSPVRKSHYKHTTHDRRTCMLHQFAYIRYASSWNCPRSHGIADIGVFHQNSNPPHILSRRSMILSTPRSDFGSFATRDCILLFYTGDIRNLVLLSADLQELNWRWPIQSISIKISKFPQ